MGFGRANNHRGILRSRGHLWIQQQCQAKSSKVTRATIRVVRLVVSTRKTPSPSTDGPCRQPHFLLLPRWLIAWSKYLSVYVWNSRQCWHFHRYMNCWHGMFKLHNDSCVYIVWQTEVTYFPLPETPSESGSVAVLSPQSIKVIYNYTDES